MNMHRRRFSGRNQGVPLGKRLISVEIWGRDFRQGGRDRSAQNQPLQDLTFPTRDC